MKSGQTADLLKHEQGHYGIVALLARDFLHEPRKGQEAQTNHRLDPKAQEKLDKALAEARANATRLTAALKGLGVGSP